MVRLIGTSGTQRVVRTRMNYGEQCDFFVISGAPAEWSLGSVRFLLRVRYTCCGKLMHNRGAVPVGPYILCENAANYDSI